MPRRSYRMASSRADTSAQEATSEDLRIAIDAVFREFLQSDETEYSFSASLNNLQRKYIHEKSKLLNIASRSHGKEPNRILTISKKKLCSLNDTYNLKICKETDTLLSSFVAKYGSECTFRDYKKKPPQEKTFGKLSMLKPTYVQAPDVKPHLANFRQSLPIFELKSVILKAINTNQIVILSSETGSGKTTQIPQYIMDDCLLKNEKCLIICTQPRRISTVAVAERVSEERGHELGTSVGYHIRLESMFGVHTNLIYCTNGVLVRSLMSGEDCLDTVTHILIDEVHERDKLSDFLLICLKKYLPLYPKLKLILMSATVNTEKFKEYFNSSVVLSIPGRSYPIKQCFLEDILQIMQYESGKMKALAIDSQTSDVTYAPFGSEMDQALTDIDSDNNEEAWAQIQIYFFTEKLCLDYQHYKTGMTALMIAAKHGDFEKVKLLSGCGANVNIRCKLNGKTAFDYANENNHQEIVDYLSQKMRTSFIPPHLLLDYYIKSVQDDEIDYQLVTYVITFIHIHYQKGAILVFLPGYDDIMLVNDTLNEVIENSNTYQTFFLHGSMNIKDQHAVFRPLEDKRKIILATNIAETSITINDVKYVIDCGKAKEKSFDSVTGSCSLQRTWISKACVKQRAGRCGRTSEGYSFHIFSSHRYNSLQNERTPEILRVPLEELCLHTKVIAPSIPLAEFFTSAVDPPSTLSVRAAIDSLISLGAMNGDESLTCLGEYLGQLTIDPHLGKMLLYSVVFRCLDPILTLVSVMSIKDPFQLPPQANLKSEAGAKRRSLTEGVESDHVIYIRAFQVWQDFVHSNRENEFCNKYFISKSTMNMALMVRAQLVGQLRAAGFIQPKGINAIGKCNVNSNNWAIIKGVIATGLYPRIAFNKFGQLCNRTEKKIHISNTSVLYNKSIDRTMFIMYEEINKIKSNSTVRGATVITPITTALLCGIDCEEIDSNEISIDEWLNFTVPNPNLVVLRKNVDCLVQKILTSADNFLTHKDEDIVNTVVNILKAEDHSFGFIIPNKIGARPYLFERVLSRRNNTYCQMEPVNAYNGSNSNIVGNNRPQSSNMISNYECIYLLIKPKQISSVKIAFETGKWIFSPQTQKKIYTFFSHGRRIILFYTVIGSGEFQGVAEFQGMSRRTDKPETVVEWLYKADMPYTCTRHLRNPMNSNRVVSDGPDGQELEPATAKELLKVFTDYCIQNSIGFAQSTSRFSNNRRY